VEVGAKSDKNADLVIGVLKPKLYAMLAFTYATTNFSYRFNIPA